MKYVYILFKFPKKYKTDVKNINTIRKFNLSTLFDNKIKNSPRHIELWKTDY